jgi:hypothetical protein
MLPAKRKNQETKTKKMATKATSRALATAFGTMKTHQSKD